MAQGRGEKCERRPLQNGEIQRYKSEVCVAFCINTLKISTFHSLLSVVVFTVIMR